MPRLRTLLVALALGSTVAAAADVLSTWHLPPAELKEKVFEVITAGDLHAFPGHKALKAVPTASRVAVVQAMGALIKAWTKTADFQARYRAWRADEVPGLPEPVKTRSQLIRETKAEIARNRADLAVAIKAAGPDQKDMAANMRAQSESGFKEMLARAESPGAELEDRQRYEAEMDTWKEASLRVQQDPRLRIKVVLEAFLDDTATVAYGAKLNSRREFASDALEEKSPAWKAAYRAGPEATEAARAFATAWLKELK